MNLPGFHSDALGLLSVPKEWLNDVVELGICPDRAVTFCTDGTYVPPHKGYLFILIQSFQTERLGLFHFIYLCYIKRWVLEAETMKSEERKKK